MNNAQTSVVTRQGDTVVKKIFHYTDYNVFEREVLVLSMLQRFDWCPRLLSHDEESKQIVMSFCGEPVNHINIPEDALDQAESILRDLKSLGIKHNDIKPDEVLVKDGKLFLCDFGWCCVNGDFSFGREDICSREKPCGIIDDTSIVSICKSQIKKKKLFETHPEMHIFIDWSRHHKKEDLVKLIESKGLAVTEVKTMSFDDDRIASRFYGQEVSDERFKTPLNLYLVEDPSPVYDVRHTTRGNRYVNVNVFDLKQKVRSITNGQIHATDNIHETKDNMKVLGLKYPQKTFSSIKSVFEMLNKRNVNYVVLRGFEQLPDGVKPSTNLDVNILTDDFFKVNSILDGVCAGGSIYDDGDYHESMSKKRRLAVNAGQSTFYVDVRFVGDDYYPKEMQTDILKNKVFNGALYTPSKEYHKYALMYHEMLHKGRPCPYGEGTQSLKDWMNAKGYSLVTPKDKSISFKSC